VASAAGWIGRNMHGLRTRRSIPIRLQCIEIEADASWSKSGYRIKRKNASSTKAIGSFFDFCQRG
jgi:hypothetical protein